MTMMLPPVSTDQQVINTRYVVQEAFRKLEVTGKLQGLPPALVGEQRVQADMPQQPGSRKQRRPL
jgi:hypothetical protein